MRNPKLRLATWSYDRTRPLIDGSIGIDGYEIEPIVLRPEETFARAFSTSELDICELSFSNSVTAASCGTLNYSLIPVFLSRAFRHSALFVSTTAGIERPADLAGKRIGLQEYDMTAAVVVRGFLRDGYSVDTSSILWKVGELERTKPLAFPLAAPPGLQLEELQPTASLESRLLAGELDAIISLRTPPSLARGDTRIRRLFADPTTAERDWFRSSGVFPIMHAVGIRKDLAARDPALALSAFRAFLAAKQHAISELEVIQAPKVTLPWPHSAVAEARMLFGGDPWPYGISANRRTLEAQLRWSHEDGLQSRRVTLSDLFAATCMDT